MMLVALAVLALFASAAQAKPFVVGHVSEGLCPNITEKYDFDPVPYLGRWYEIERFEMIFESQMDCVNAIYSDLGEGYVEVHNSARKKDGTPTDIIGKAHAIAPGVLLVEFAGHIPAEYHILDTDYENFSSVYNCIQEGILRFQFAWVLSRTMTLDEAIYTHAKQVFADNDIDVTIFQTTYQGDDCPYP
ncbi:apolipoprotein D-like [Macrobrachium nipponense]|uniref:apolipoprotein D-like n=1 Tax=Macrobrachium nipponense TaxID=159736 RepID=UPI0030C8A4C7